MGSLRRTGLGKIRRGGETFSDEDEYENGIWELMCADKDWLERYFESICFHQQLEGSLESME